MEDRLERIGFKSSLESLLETVCKDYEIGIYQDHQVIEKGYEDLNVELETSKGKFLVKIFNSRRSDVECRKYVEVMNTAIDSGVKHPELYHYNGESLYTYQNTHLCVMDFIKGSTVEEERLDKDDIRFLGEQAALINSLDIEPHENHDSWAIPNFPDKFEKTRKYLSEKELEVLESLLEEFNDIDFESLPHCFVHGDIRETNVMRDDNGELWVLDFSVSGIYPRIQELAVIASSILLDENRNKTQENIETLIEEYRSNTGLTDQELDTLPILIDVGFAMNFVSAKYEKEANDVYSEENEYWLQKGKKGLNQNLRDSLELCHGIDDS